MISQIKQWAKRLPYPIFLRVFYFVYRWRELRQGRHTLHRTNIPLASREIFAERKRSDVLFVLGSGTSINQIAPQRWEAIARQDSLGLNFWVLHNFVPTFYFFESFEIAENPGAAEAMLTAFRRRAADYANTRKMVMEFHRTGRQVLDELPAQFRQNLYAAFSIPAPARSAEELNYALNYLARKGLFDAGSNYHRVFKYAATLTTVISLAAKLGYRKLVLCGVDLTRQEYFFNDPALYPETANLWMGERNQPHDTNVPLEWRLPVAQVIEILRQRLLGPAGHEIYVENPKSALYPQIPLAPAELFSPD